MSGMEELLLAAAEVQAICVRHSWKFCFIGGVAVQRWGNPRFTQDIDLTLLTGFGEEEKFLETLLREFDPRRPDAHDFALHYRVFLGRTRRGVDVDIAFGAFPFEQQSVERATPWPIRQGLALVTCSAEDLIVHKTFAGRDRDWADVETVLIRQHGKLDLDLIRSALPPLLELKGEPESLRKLERMLATVEARLRERP